MTSLLVLRCGASWGVHFEHHLTNYKEIKMKTSSAKKSSPKSNRDIHQEITDQMIAALEADSPPWIKPWKDSGTGASMSMPHNAGTGRAYSGINVLLLWSAGYSSNGWITYNQARALGGNVRKGEKGTLVTLYKKIDVTENKGTADEKAKKVGLLRGFTVFNVEQCDFPEGTKFYTEKDHDNQSTVSEIAKDCGAVVKFGGNKACFIPSADQINMPHKKQFKCVGEFESTLAHELTHWTGAKARLARDLSGRFGDESYAAEELVAEIGAAFLCAQLGIPNKKLQHTQYVKNWIRVLQNDKKAIFTAASLARQSNEYVLSMVEAGDDEEE